MWARNLHRLRSIVKYDLEEAAEEAKTSQVDPGKAFRPTSEGGLIRRRESAPGLNDVVVRAHRGRHPSSFGSGRTVKRNRGTVNS